MKREVNGDLKISGSGTASGGLYNNVEISGSGKVEGDIECERFKTSGSSKIHGNVTTQFFKVSGSSHIFGHVEADSVEVSGSTHIDGHLGAKQVQISGSCHVDRHLAALDLEIKGGAVIDENCSADRFYVSGSFTINGLLNADKIDVELYHKSYAREIGGETINIRVGQKGFVLGKLLNSFLNNELTVDCIEGDNIYLENTIAKVVRGTNIRVGTGCQIGLVEYENQLEVISDGEVKERRKI